MGQQPAPLEPDAPITPTPSTPDTPVINVVEPAIGITVDKKAEVGDVLIAEMCLKQKGEVFYRWKLWRMHPDGHLEKTTPKQLQPLDGGQRVVVGTKNGKFLLTGLGYGKEGFEEYEAEISVGPPTPPEPQKTLAELAGKDASALVKAYTESAQAIKVGLTPRVDLLNKLIVDVLTAYKVGNNPAAAVVAARLQDVLGSDSQAAVDKPLADKVLALLEQVVKELDVQPKPPEPTNDLAKLVPDPAVRAALATMYEGLAGAVAAGGITTTGQFRSEQSAKVKELGLKGLSAINKPISERILAAVGTTADVSLEGELGQKLADALNQIAEDFRG